MADQRARRIIVTGDVFRVMPGHEGDGPCDQDANIRWLHDLLKWPVSEATGLVPEVLSWDRGTGQGLCVPDFHSLSGHEPGFEAWARDYGRTALTASELDFLRGYFHQALVLGFELSPMQQSALDSLGVGYVALSMHPVRFLDDLMFMARTNVPAVADRLDGWAVDERLFRGHAGFRRAQARRRFQEKLEPGALLFCGQVAADAALLDEGRMHGLLDYRTEFAALTQTAPVVYFKRHPHVHGDDDILDFVTGFPNVRLVDWDTYDLMARDEIAAVAALSSSVLTEAVYFGKRVHRLFCRPAQILPALDGRILGARFWAEVLSGVLPCREPAVDMPTNTPNPIQAALVVNWRRPLSEQCATGSESADMDKQLAQAIQCNSQGRLAEAERLCRAILRGKPLQPIALHLLGVVLCRGGRAAEGETVLRRLVALQPGNEQALRHLGDALHAQGKMAASVEVYRRLLAVAPKDGQGHLSLGVSLQAMGNLDEAIEACAQALVLQSDLPQGYFILASILHQLGRLTEAAAAYMRALDQAPDDAAAYLNLGNVLADQGKHEDALLAYDHALQRRPGWAEALTNAGLATLHLGRPEQAAALHERAVQNDPGFCPGWTNLGGALQRLGRYGEAVEAFGKAAALRPQNPLVLSNLAQALGEAGQGEAALERHRAAVAAGPENAVAHFNLGIALLQAGHYAEGWREYAWRWRGGVPALVSRGFSQPEWDGADLAGRTLLVHAEQGLGDTIQFARFVGQAARRGGKVVFEVQPALATLLAGIRGASQVVFRGQELPSFEVHAPLMSLPGILGIGEGALAADLPLIPSSPHPERSGAGRRVGLVWRGNPAHRADRQRSIGADLMLDRLSHCPVRLSSLQKNATEADHAALARHLGRIDDREPALNDFTDTAAAIADLDLVIAVDTAVAHLAGAMGRPVWLLLPYAADWRWRTEREDTPWYPSMRLFRQSTPGDWDEVLDRVVQALS